MQDFNDNITNLFNICFNNEQYHKKIEPLYDFIVNSYPLLDDKVELKLGYSINDENFSLLKKYLIYILKCLKNNVEYFNEEVEDMHKEKLNQIFVIVYNYLSNRIDLRNTKFSIYLILFDINYENFYNLSFNATATLVELKFYGVNVAELSGIGNFQIVLVGEIANGVYPNKQQIKIIGDIAQIVDECMDSGEMYEIDLEKDSLIFEPIDDDIVSVYLYSNVDEPLAIINNDNEFIHGDIETLLQFFPLSNEFGTELDEVINQN